MADEIDVSNEKAQISVDAGVLAIRRMAAAMAEGAAGECVSCGEDSPRLVNKVCPRCRDIAETRRRKLGIV